MNGCGNLCSFDSLPQVVGGLVAGFQNSGCQVSSWRVPHLCHVWQWVLAGSWSPSRENPPKKTLSPVEPGSWRKQIFQVAFHGATAMCEGNVKIPYAWFPCGFPYAYRQEFTMLRSSHQKIDLKLPKRAFDSLRYRPQDAVQKKSRRESNALIARPSRLNLVGNN